MAVVISWGAKFSEHPLLVKDRARNNGQSLLARTLINRARELAEDLKVHRVPNADHVVVALLIEPMQNRECVPAAYHCQRLVEWIIAIFVLQRILTITPVSTILVWKLLILLTTIGKASMGSGYSPPSDFCWICRCVFPDLVSTTIFSLRADFITVHGPDQPQIRDVEY